MHRQTIHLYVTRKGVPHSWIGKSRDVKAPRN
jgi:hypothetical protein